MRQLLIIVLLSGLCFCSGQLLAQPEEGYTDSELWTGFTFKLHLNKKWRAEAEQQIRLEEHYQRMKSTFTEVGIRYEFTDFLDAKLQYRFTANKEERNDHRTSLDVNLEWDINDCPLDIGYRLRLQDTKVDYTGQKITYARNRISLDYNLSKLVDPFFEYESFYRFNEKKEFRNGRFTLGLEWKLSDALDLETYFRIDQEKNVKLPERQEIIGLMLSYSTKLR